jgi:hypothetical protein
MSTRDNRGYREERGNRDVTQPMERSSRRDPYAAEYDERPRRSGGGGAADDYEDRPRRDRGDAPRDPGSREDDRGGWRRRPAGSPLGDNDDDIDLPSFLRKRR